MAAATTVRSVQRDQKMDLTPRKSNQTSSNPELSRYDERRNSFDSGSSTKSSEIEINSQLLLTNISFMSSFIFSLHTDREKCPHSNVIQNFFEVCSHSIAKKYANLYNEILYETSKYDDWLMPLSEAFKDKNFNHSIIDNDVMVKIALNLSKDLEAFRSVVLPFRIINPQNKVNCGVNCRTSFCCSNTPIPIETTLGSTGKQGVSTRRKSIILEPSDLSPCLEDEDWSVSPTEENRPLAQGSSISRRNSAPKTKFYIPENSVKDLSVLQGNRPISMISYGGGTVDRPRPSFNIGSPNRNNSIVDEATEKAALEYIRNTNRMSTSTSASTDSRRYNRCSQVGLSTYMTSIQSSHLLQQQDQMSTSMTSSIAPITQRSSLINNRSSVIYGRHSIANPGSGTSHDFQSSQAMELRTNISGPNENRFFTWLEVLCPDETSNPEYIKDWCKLVKKCYTSITPKALFLQPLIEVATTALPLILDRYDQEEYKSTIEASFLEKLILEVFLGEKKVQLRENDRDMITLILYDKANDPDRKCQVSIAVLEKLNSENIKDFISRRTRDGGRGRRSSQGPINIHDRSRSRSKSRSRLNSITSHNTYPTSYASALSLGDMGEKRRDKILAMQNYGLMDNGLTFVLKVMSSDQDFTQITEKKFDQKTLNSIRKLVLDQTLITDETLSKLGVLLPNLRQLSIKDCKKISHRGLEQLICGLSSDYMTGFNFTDCGQFSDESILECLLCFPNINELILNGTKLSDTSWLKLKENLIHLSNYDIRYTEAFGLENEQKRQEIKENFHAHADFDTHNNGRNGSSKHGKIKSGSKRNSIMGVTRRLSNVGRSSKIGYKMAKESK